MKRRTRVLRCPGCGSRPRFKRHNEFYLLRCINRSCGHILGIPFRLARPDDIKKMLINSWNRYAIARANK